MNTAEKLKITPEQYLEGEKVAEIRHEYVDGEIFAMAGSSDAHASISGNIFADLKAQLRGSECKPYISDMKVKTSETQYFYPDVMVTCDERDLQHNYSKLHPILIIEVLSPTTESYDRGKKFEYYRQLESLQEYALISQDDYHVDIFRKNKNQRFELFSFSDLETQIYFASINCHVDMAILYEDVNFN
jgi:Uma2 family endonuclease